MDNAKIPLDTKKVREIHRKIKDAIVRLAVVEDWDVDGVALGIAITLGDYINFAYDCGVITISKEEYATLCKNIIDAFMKGEGKIYH